MKRGASMAYENLLKSVEESAQEKERELREKARSAVEVILEDAKKQADVIQQSLMAESEKAAAIEKNKLIYLTKGENKEKMIKTKEAIFSQAFTDAEQNLMNVRERPNYPDILTNFIREAVGVLGEETFHIHIDKRDEKLTKKILSELHISGDVIADLQCSGGLVVSTQKESIKISNTIESRLERAKEQKKLEIYAVLNGD
jgi:V/A-type H+-transporting ATPase subunit E